MRFEMIHSAEDIVRLVRETGFLPFFRNGIPGYSLEECTPPEIWFSDKEPGPWEWKGPVIRQSGCAYGKLFCGRAGFVSREWYPDFANYRRDGYDFDARFDDELAPYQDKLVFDVLDGYDSLISRELKRLSGFGHGGRKGFDGIVTRLQMQCYIVTADFEYSVDRHGNTYGWGVARYATPEHCFGQDFTDNVYRREPQESGRRIREHLSGLLPDASEKQIRRLIG